VVYIANPESSVSTAAVEYTKRVYDMGILADRRDFNGDGVVNVTDRDDFLAQWNAYSGTLTACNWIHGDVDQDNDVDQQDKLKYLAWYHVFVPPGQQPPVIPINLGDADEMDVFAMPF
jgi:hypothetical protein